MKHLILTLFILFWCISAKAQDTFSIIAVDPVTGEIGSAGASCVTGVGSGGIIDIITKIIPGRGGVNSQAFVCIPNINLNNAINQMENGATPQEIINWLLLNDQCGSQNFDPQFRQYGIADFDENGDPRTAGFSGNMTNDYSEDRQGTTFSIQGNILLNQTVIDNMEANFNNTTGTLADKLMAAMQGANFAGADSRCLAAGTSSTTAYLLVYRPDDDPSDPYLRLNVGQQPSGVEPIDILQDLYDNFLTIDENALLSLVSLYPNPVTNLLQLKTDISVGLEAYTIYDVSGKRIISNNNLKSKDIAIDVSSLSKGMYFITIKGRKGTATLQFAK